MVAAPAAGGSCDQAPANAASSSTWQPTRSYSEVILHQSCAHFTLSIINHQHQVCLCFDSLGNHSCPDVTAPENYEQVKMSKRIQGSATCGPHALFAALAYAADMCGLRSSCSPLETELHDNDSNDISSSRGASECSTIGESLARDTGSKRCRGSTTADRSSRKSRKRNAKDGTITARTDKSHDSRAGRLQHALAACYGFAVRAGKASESISCSKADIVVSAAYLEATRLLPVALV